MVESHLRWFGHVCKRPIEALVGRVELVKSSLIARDRARSRKIIGETIEKKLDFNGLTIDMVNGRILWYCMIYVVDPT